MKWTTANFKNPNYSGNHEIFVGTHTGSFKRLSVSQENDFVQKNLQDIGNLNKDSKVTALSFGNEQKTEVLIGRANKFAQVYSADTEEFCSNVELLESPIVGLARYDVHLIAGFGTGKIQKLQNPQSLILSAGDNISRMRQCVEDQKLIATGGKDRQNNLKVFDLEGGKQIFSSKNLPNDSLQLEVPIWDSDIGFIDSKIVATCSRYGYVRLYDIRKQRRPVQKYSNENQLSFSSLIACGNYVYTGTTMGALKAFDVRNFKNFVHTYKGFTGGISDLCLDDSGKFLVSASLDRYVRVHQTDSTVMMYQCYVKSKATRVVVKNIERASPREEDNLEDEEIKEEPIIIDSRKEDKSDPEYDALFDRMQTVCESNSDNESESKKLAEKRKLKLKNGKLKKKKI